MGDDGTRIQKKQTASMRQLSSTKKRLERGRGGLIPGSRICFLGLGGDGVGMSQVANGARFVI